MKATTSKDLYQWDLDVQAIINLDEGESINEVHFEDVYSTTALVVPITSTEDGVVVNIPNILLQRKLPVRMYVVKSDQTITEFAFMVTPRQRPSDYVYTETEVLTYRALEERIEKLEQNGGSGGSYVEVDTTLTMEGMAADAKATGDAIKKINDELADAKALVTFNEETGDLDFTALGYIEDGNGVAY